MLSASANAILNADVNTDLNAHLNAAGRLQAEGVRVLARTFLSSLSSEKRFLNSFFVFATEERRS